MFSESMEFSHRSSDVSNPLYRPHGAVKAVTNCDEEGYIFSDGRPSVDYYDMHGDLICSKYVNKDLFASLKFVYN
jgi:hypothetical protein